MEIKTTLDNSFSQYPKNLRQLGLSLNYDKGSSEAKVSINSFEFVKNEAELLVNKANGEGLGVGFGVPYKIELGKKGIFQTILDGHIDLMSHEKLSCREVIAPVIDRGGNDFLTQTADTFTYDFLFNRRPDLLDKTMFKYVPYVKNRFDNLELASALFTLTNVIITIEQAIEGLIGVVGELAAFSWEKLVRIIIYAIYIFFLLRTAILLTQTILDMIIGQVKYHAGMTALQLCQIGAAYKGYQFTSTILEGDFEKLVIIPPKEEIFEDDNNSLITGHIIDRPDEQLGYYKGTFGQLLRDLIIMFNGKIIIEDSLTGGQKTIRLERDDFNPSQKLYTLPNVNLDDEYTLNTTEFNAVHQLSYLKDEQDINTYQFTQGSTVTEILEPIDKGVATDYGNLMKGFDDTTIPFSKGIRKSEITRTERIIGEVLDVLSPLINEMVFIFNSQTYNSWLYFNFMWDNIDTVLAFHGFGRLSPIVEIFDVDNPLPSLQELPIVTVPDFANYISSREGAMLLESDYLSTHRVVMLDSNFNTSLPEASTSQIAEFAMEHDFPFLTEELADLLSGIESTGTLFNNSLTEDNDTVLSALNIYQSFHQIKSFIPSNERPLGNQWKIVKADKVKFCYDDWQLLKTDNKFIDADGNECLLESLDWFPFDNNANFVYRINFNYFKNLQLKNGTLLEPVGK